jgi:hypothetical protein
MTMPPPPNPGGYISLPVIVDPNQLLRAVFANIQAQIPGWTPQEGQLDVAILEEAALMMSTCAAVASQVPVTIFEFYGQLVGINPILGVKATVPATFTMIDDAGYIITAGTVVAYPLSGNTQVLFTVQQTVVIPEGETTADVILVCEVVGSFANGLPALACQLTSTFSQVATVATTGAVSGGVDAETQTAYINRLSTELQLLAPRPILPQDFAELATNVPGVFRALAIDGLNPGRTITDGVTTATNPDISSATAGFVSALDVGRLVDASGITPGTSIDTVTDSNDAVLSADATVTATGVTMTFEDLTGQERCVTVSGLDIHGNALTDDINAQMQAYLQAKREVNFIVGTVFPTKTAVDVSVTCDAIPGADLPTVQAAISAALTNFLSPATWGGGNQVPPIWSPTSGTVRFLDIANAILSTPGVLYIAAGDLSIALAGDGLDVNDLTLPGDAPLPTAGSFTIVVNA